MSALQKYKWLSLAHKCHLKANLKIAASNIHIKIDFMLKADIQKEPPYFSKPWHTSTNLTRQGFNCTLFGKDDAHRFIIIT